MATETMQNTDPVVALTPKAVAHIRRTMDSEGVAGQALRIAVVTGGCSGNEYALSFKADADDGDVAYEIDGLKVLVDGASVDALAGTVLDYVDGLYGAGLKFKNPQAAHSCGCGASFCMKLERRATREPQRKMLNMVEAFRGNNRNAI